MNDEFNALLILKLDMWEFYVKNNNAQQFKKLSDFLIESGINLNKDVRHNSEVYFSVKNHY